jgi:hypothetical protein
VLARGQRFALPTGSTGFFKTENFKNWWQSVAVGNCSQLSTGSGWAVL